MKVTGFRGEKTVATIYTLSSFVSFLYSIFFNFSTVSFLSTRPFRVIGFWKRWTIEYKDVKSPHAIHVSSFSSSSSAGYSRLELT